MVITYDVVVADPDEYLYNCEPISTCETCDIFNKDECDGYKRMKGEKDESICDVQGETVPAGDVYECVWF